MTLSKNIEEVNSQTVIENNIVPSSIFVFLFVDDHTVIIQLKATLVKEEMTAIYELQESAIHINGLINNNKLNRNASKIELIVFGSRQQLDKCTTNKILFCGDSIKLQYCIKSLGVFLDNTLDFKEHNRRKCQTAI